MPKYRVTTPSYRLGEYLLPGTIIDVPENEASKKWVRLDDEGQEVVPSRPTPPPSQEVRRRTRPSDSEPGV